MLSVEANFYRISDDYKILRTDDTLQTNSAVRFQSRINPSISYVKYHCWKISALDSNCIDWNFNYAFDKNGVYAVKFHAIDHFGDTLIKNLNIIVASKPVCQDTLNLKIFQGSPIFSWECHDKENLNLSYVFTLKNKDDIEGKDSVYILQEKTLQLGFALPDNFEISLIASNGYIKDTLSKWRLDE